MSIFTIKKDNKIDIAVENLIIPEFREIYDRDKSKDKSKAFNELAYVYHMADYKSIYQNFSEVERSSKIMKDFFKESLWRPDIEVNNAILKYQELQETPSMKLWKAAKKAFSKVEDYYNKVDINERDSRGNIVNKITDLSSSIGNLGKMIESLNKLEDQIKKESAKESKVRGGADIADDERI